MTNDDHTNSFASMLTKAEIQMIVDTLFSDQFGELLVPLTDEEYKSFFGELNNNQLRLFWDSMNCEEQ